MSTAPPVPPRPYDAPPPPLPPLPPHILDKYDESLPHFDNPLIAPKPHHAANVCNIILTRIQLITSIDLDGANP